MEVSIGDLPDLLGKSPMLTFMVKHPYYSDPAESVNCCVEASRSFLKRVSGQEVGWTWKTATKRSPVDGFTRGYVLPPVVEAIYRSPRSQLGWDYGDHTAVLVEGRYFIDFTARQFDPDAPWPLIWEAPYGKDGEMYEREKRNQVRPRRTWNRS